MKLLYCMFVISLVATSFAIIDVNPRQNIWVTWANETGQDSFCLSMATPSDPFRTCLIGVPLSQWEQFNIFKGWTNNWEKNITKIKENYCNGLKNYNTGKTLKELAGNCIKYICNMANKLGEAWCKQALAEYTKNITEGLNMTAPFDPQELELLGSVAGNYCIEFGYPPEYPWKNSLISIIPTNQSTLIASKNKWYKKGGYCGIGYIANVENITTKPMRLPPGIFLICGDRAWAGVPKKPWGGYCYYGKITLFAPSIQQTLHSNGSWNRKPLRIKRSVKQLDGTCKDNVQLWDTPSNIIATLLAPMIAAAQALKQLERLACWTGKQINRTSDILTQLTTDVDSVRHAVLQNRAAIDFLLLAQGHGCEEFEGMCCLNISDHSESIHKKLQELKDNMKKLTIATNPLEDWLHSLGITGWLKSVVMMFVGPVLI